jgi:hypothetical protein
MARVSHSLRRAMALAERGPGGIQVVGDAGDEI